MVLNNLAKAYAESGKYELAEEMAREAVRIAEQTQNTHLSRFVANLGTILNLEGINLLTCLLTCCGVNMKVSQEGLAVMTVVVGSLMALFPEF